ncbi:MAG: hypothetical protein JW891_17525 [Candidatus Lokiarchaeota archaeon]|nr:hypothetical protein [Candidatus Lokiarchaeota archaeon]
MMDLFEYREFFTKKQIVRVDSLCGRIIRGVNPDDFETLTDDPDRKLVMLMGPDGLQKLLGKESYDMLVEIGYEKEYIQRKLNEGNEFKLVVFKEGGEAIIATWDNVINLVSKTYPNISNKIKDQIDDLKSTSFERIEEEAGFDFSKIDKIGKTDPRFMTHERYLESPNTLIAARAFLYFTVHLRELFSGDGYTYTTDGKRGLTEYIVPNKRISDLGEHVIIDIQF